MEAPVLRKTRGVKIKKSRNHQNRKEFFLTEKVDNRQDHLQSNSPRIQDRPRVLVHENRQIKRQYLGHVPHFQCARTRDCQVRVLIVGEYDERDAPDVY